MADETQMNGLVNSESTILNSASDEGSSSMWLWMLVIIIMGLCVLGGYYYILYIYDSPTLEDAVEKLIKRFNASTAEVREEGWNKDYENRTGETGPHDNTESTPEKKILTAVLDDASSEGFSNYISEVPSSNIQKLGQLNWCFIDDSNGCNATSNDCMSGDIFPTRDICINPKLRTL